MPLFAKLLQKMKSKYFLKQMSIDNKILEIGCGNGWVKKYCVNNGYKNYMGIDINPPADIVGDIRNWENLGLQKGSFDTIIAFEVLEHVDCLGECYELLKPGGKLMITSPMPHMDWLLKIFEKIGFVQKRTSPHIHLIYFRNINIFSKKIIKNIAFVSQWGIFTK